MIRSVLGSRASIGGVLGSGRGGAAAAWYLAGGVSAANCIAAYTPIGAASLAASYDNNAAPGNGLADGTYDAAPGTAPTFDSATGWTFNGSTQYLNTGVTPSDAWTMIVRFSNLTNTAPIAGMYYPLLGVENRFYLTPNHSTGNRQYANGSTLSYLRPGAAITSGVMGFAGKAAYLNGAADGTIPAGTMSGALGIRIGSEYNAYASVKIQAFAIYDTTLSGAQFAEISSAMSAL